MSFSDMKKNRAKDLEALGKAATEAYEGKKNYKTEDFWRLDYDKKTGNGQAVIRFLPAKGADAPFWIQYWDYFFKNEANGQYYVEKSLSTLGEKDPVGEYSSKLWNSGEEGKKKIKEIGMTRKLHYVTNILVIDHPGNPEDNGKVFKFKFGKKLFSKIKEAMSPEFEGEDPINPFDFWEGANFKIRRKIVEKWPNYDSSQFEEVSVLDESEARLEEIYNSMEDIQELISPDKFKSYDELKTKFNRVMGISANAPEMEYASNEKEAPMNNDMTDEESEAEATESEEEASDETLSYFQNMVNG